MSIILTEDLTKNIEKGWSNYRGDYNASDYFSWMKGCRTEKEDTYLSMQQQVSCKDYILDTQLRNITTTGIDLRNWTKEQIRQNVVILFCNKSRHDKITANVQRYLNPLEESIGLKPTKLLNVDEAFGRTFKHVLILDGDDRWNSNGFIWSYYLSVIRALAHTNIKLDINLKDLFKLCEGCNEEHYYSNLGTNKIRLGFFDFIANNFSSFLKPVNKTGYDEYSGHSNKQQPNHGTTGPFYLSNFCGVHKQLELYTKYDYPLPKSMDNPKYINYFIELYLEGE